MKIRDNNIKRIIISIFTALCMAAAMIPVDLSSVNAEETDPALQQDTLYQEEQNDYSLAGEDVPEAEINGIQYSTLQQALDAVNDGQKIKILDNIVQDNLVINKPGIKFLVDLNGKNITGVTGHAAVILEAGSAGFYDSTCEGTTGTSGTITAAAGE